MDPFWLNVDHVLRIHASLIEHYGGPAGVRDVGLLQSAVAVPRASFGGQALHGDLFSRAAAYMFHLVQNHPFVDGNKRVGAAAGIIFLALNGIELVADEDGLVDLTMAVARGEADKTAIAEFFRARSQGEADPADSG